jgi:hypothetical protein
MICFICDKKLTGKQTKYCSNICKSRDSNVKHQNYQAQKKRAIKRKVKLITKYGGKCMHCGYKKNIASLCFHHRDPGEKEFELDARSISNLKPDRLEKEAAKCDLLCSNCHMETHYPDLELALLLQFA